jgi:hypothetical protein
MEQGGSDNLEALMRNVDEVNQQLRQTQNCQERDRDHFLNDAAVRQVHAAAMQDKLEALQAQVRQLIDRMSTGPSGTATGHNSSLGPSFPATQRVEQDGDELRLAQQQQVGTEDDNGNGDNGDGQLQLPQSHGLQADTTAEALLSSMTASLATLARGGNAMGSSPDNKEAVAPIFDEDLPKRNWAPSTLPASPLMIDTHMVEKLLARATKWRPPQLWDLSKLNVLLVKELPHGQASVSKETAGFTHSMLRSILLTTADIEKAVTMGDADAVMNLLLDIRWAVGAAVSKNTTELFRKTVMDKETAKKRSASQMMELTDHLGVHKEYLVKQDAVATAVFLAANLGQGGYENTGARKEQRGGKFTKGSGKGGERFQPGAASSNLQQALRFLGAGQRSTEGSSHASNAHGTNGGGSGGGQYAGGISANYKGNRPMQNFKRVPGTTQAPTTSYPAVPNQKQQ